jgi:WXXGXW repeat (2 copies)
MLKFIRIRYILLACLLGMTPSLSYAFVSITIAPPPLVEYEQPLCPGDGYLWEPGYWAWGDDDYYWVPGVWIEAPEVGFLWTPGYWGFEDSAYIWHVGFWGPHCGFYGGINYGFGYFGSGFVGGVWAGNVFRYNTAVWRVNTALVHNTFVDRTVIRNTNNRVSFNGPGGINVKPTAEEEAAMHERHLEATDKQREHEQAALHDRNQRYSINHGHPSKTALNTGGGLETKGGNKGHETTGGNKGHETTGGNKGHETTGGNRGHENAGGNQGKQTGGNQPKGGEKGKGGGEKGKKENGQ